MISRSYDNLVSLSKLVHLMLGCDELKENDDGFYKNPDNTGYTLIAKWQLKADYKAMAANPQDQMKAALACIEEIADRCASQRIRDLERDRDAAVKLAKEAQAETLLCQKALAIEVANAAKYRDFYELQRGVKA